jgi:hypothetical protein
MRQNTLDLVDLLIETVSTARASILVEKCHELGMTPQKYQPSPAVSNLPDFDVGHQFRFEADSSWAAGFDILEKDGMVLQAGFQIFYPRAFFVSKSKKHYQAMIEQIERHYGPGVPMKVGGIMILNYGDTNTVCYISKAKALGKDLITVRVGNKIFWR